VEKVAMLEDMNDVGEHPVNTTNKSMNSFCIFIPILFATMF
jgi:hypothetical protein